MDNILPDVGHRQWVLTVPYAIRPLLLRDPKRFAQVSRIFVRALFSYQRRLAAQEGCTETYPAAVAFPQLFGGALNPNPHLHVLAPDGVHVGAGPERPLDVLELGPPSQADVERLLKKVAGKVNTWVTTYLEPHGCDGDTTDSSQEADDPLRDQVMGQPPTLHGAADLSPQPPAENAPPHLCARQDGFSLHAATSVRPGDPDGLLRMVRYCARQAFSQQQLSELEDGRLCYALKRPFGPHRTRALVMSPTELLHRLAQLVPKPYFNLTRYYGAYAPNARRRAEICPLTAPRKRYRRRRHTSANEAPQDPAPRSAPPLTEPDTGRPARIPWAELLKRTHHDDILRCPKCLKVAMSVIAVITDSAVLKKILTHLDLPTTLPSLGPTRYADPQLDFDWDACTQDDTEWGERHCTPPSDIEARAPS